jgi:outer membrane usher protein
VGEAAETLVLKVSLNTVDQGEFVLIQTEDADILIPQESFQTLGFLRVPTEAIIIHENQPHVSLRAMKGVLVQLDMGQAALLITANPRLLQKQVQDLSGSKREPAPKASPIPSAFINYNLQYDIDDSSRQDSFGIPLEVGVSDRGLFGLSTFSYTHTPQDTAIRRISTHLIWDNVNTLQRVVVGDIGGAASGDLGSGGALGGVSFSKNFSIAGGYSSPYASLSLAGEVDTPSDVSLLMNGVQVAKEHFGPGPFEFKNVPALAGAGDGYLLIRDAFGREKGVPLSYYYVSSLLKVGIQEYNYQVGVKRKRIDHYGEVAAGGTHRVGVTDRMTLGVRAEADSRRWNLGPTARLQVASWGDIDLSLAESGDGGKNGGGGVITYGYGRRRFNLRSSVAGFGRHYSNLSMGEEADKPRLRWQLGGGTGNQKAGSVSVNYQVTDLHLGTNNKQVSLTYSKGWKNISMRVSVTRAFGIETTDELFLGVSSPIQDKRFGDYFVAADQAFRKGQSTQTVLLNKNPPQGIGMGGSLQVVNDTTDGSGNAPSARSAFLYNDTRGIAGVDYQLREGGNYTSLDWAGALVMARGRVYMSRPISDNFALVSVKGVSGVRISSQNSVSAMTDARGEAILPDVHSYIENKVAVNDQDIPAYYAISSIEKRFSTPYRAGVYLPFEITRLQGFTGVFSVLEGGQKTPAEYWGLGITPLDQEIEVIVGKKGEFYLENLKPGNYPVRLFTKGKECRFEIAIPDDKEQVMVPLGELTCTLP